MIKGLYSAFNALESAWRYQDVLANNIANVGTAGFKREVASLQSFEDVLLERSGAVAAPAPLAARIQAVVGQIGTGVFVAEFATDYSPGAFLPSESPLDLALTRGFFAVQDGEGQVYYTRDGRFGRAEDNTLVTSHGHTVLAADGSAIVLPPGNIFVDSDGLITGPDGEEVARLDIRGFASADLRRAGEGYFTSDAAGEAVEPGLRQYYLEGSNANLSEELTTMLAVQRTYQANQTVLAQLNESLERAAGQLGSFGA
jgi:flagellar basal-body rod protein FlgG